MANLKETIEDAVDWLGDKVSYLGGRLTEKAEVGVQDKTLWVIGGVGAAIIATILITNNKR